MGLFRRSSSAASAPDGCARTADPKRVAAARDAQDAFVRDAGPVESWTPAQRAEFNQVVSDRQRAEMDMP